MTLKRHKLGRLDSQQLFPIHYFCYLKVYNEWLTATAIYTENENIIQNTKELCLQMHFVVFENVTNLTVKKFEKKKEISKWGKKFGILLYN